MDAKQIKNTRRRLRKLVKDGQLTSQCHYSAATEILLVKGIYNAHEPSQEQIRDYCLTNQDGLQVLEFLRERNARVAGFPHYSREVIQRGEAAWEELAKLGVA